MGLQDGHIVFICSRLDLPGGIERAVVNTANLLCTHGYPVSLMVLDETGHSFYPVDARVRIIQVNLHFGLTKKGNVITRKLAFSRHVLQLRQQLKGIKADVVIGTEYVFTISAKLALYKTGIKVFSWEHHHFHGLQKSGFWHFLTKKIYPKINGVICLNATEAALYNGMGCKTTIIPNYVAPATKKAALNTKVITTIGWLTRIKGVDLIPAVAAPVFKKHPDWQWQIIGKGEDYELLKKLIAQKDLSANIQIIPPVTYDLEAVYLNTSIYVMLSRFEVLPYVLLEAMSFGVPCVAFNCLTGPAAIIETAKNGILIEPENVQAMSNAILNLVENDQLRTELGAHACNSLARFSPQNVLKQWQQLLLS